MGGGPSQLGPPHGDGPLTFPARLWDRRTCQPSLRSPPPPLPSPFSVLPCKSVADPTPWEFGLSAAVRSKLLAQHHVGFARKRHHSSTGNFGGKSSSFVRGFQKGLSQQAARRQPGQQRASDSSPTCRSPASPEQTEGTLLAHRGGDKRLRGCKLTPTLQAGKLRLERE